MCMYTHIHTHTFLILQGWGQGIRSNGCIWMACCWGSYAVGRYGMYARMYIRMYVCLYHMVCMDGTEIICSGWIRHACMYGVSGWHDMRENIKKMSLVDMVCVYGCVYASRCDIHECMYVFLSGWHDMRENIKKNIIS